MFKRKKKADNSPKKKRSLGRKILRITGISLGSLVLLIVAAAIIIPVVFKKDIEAAIKSSIEENLDITAEIDLDKFSVTMFSSFPDLTVQMDDFGLIGKGSFEGDTLMFVGSFKVTVDLWSLFGDKMVIEGIYLDRPVMNGLVNSRGKANWDIVKDTTDAGEPVTEESSPFNLAINEWEIKDAKIVYDDKPGKMYAGITGLTHRGGGNFSDAAFDLSTFTKIKKMTIDMDGTKYFDRDSLEIDFTIGISEEMSKYTFKENYIKLNLFKFGFDGSIKLLEEGMNFDKLSYSAQETEFKNILSLVPDSYLPDFYSLDKKGSLAFDGKLDGDLNYDMSAIPVFDFNLKVKDSEFKYPDLPSKVSDINIDLNVLNKDGNLNNTNINLNNFSAALGKSDKVKAKAIIKGIMAMDIDANALVNINLGNVMSYYKIPDVKKLAGQFGLNATVKGVMSEVTMPAINAKMTMKDGYIETASFEKALEQINFNTVTNMPSTNLSEGSFVMNQFSMLLDGDRFGAKGRIDDFEEINYDFRADGPINLDKWMAMFPLEGMELKGIINLDSIKLKGDLPAIMEERYSDLENSGQVSFDKFLYNDPTLIPGPFIIDNGTASFTSRDIVLNKAAGTIGKTDFSSTGRIKNYMGYLFSPVDSILSGSLNVNSGYVDVDEWLDLYLAEDETAMASAAPTPNEDVVYEVYPLPRNIDFLIRTNAKKITYDEMDLTNMSGDLTMTDGTVRLSNVKFFLFGGKFTTSGMYTTTNAHAYDFDMKINNLGIQDAYKVFTTAKKFIPAAESITGVFSSDMSIGGPLGDDYMPIYDELNMKGLFDIKNAEAKDTKIMNAINAVTNLNNTDDIKIENTKIKAQIKDGYLEVDPFDMKAGNMKMQIAGRNGITGDLDYKMGMDVPGGAATQAFNSQLSKWGVPGQANKDIHLDFGITGTAAKPKVKLLSAGGQNVKDQAKEIIEDKIDQQIDKACDKVKPKADKILADAQKKANDIRQRSKVEADGIRKEGPKAAAKIRSEGAKLAAQTRTEANNAADEVIKKAKNPIEKKVKQKAAEELRKEGEKKAQKIERETEEKAVKAEQKANNSAQAVEDKGEASAQEVMDTAQKEVDELMKECK